MCGFFVGLLKTRLALAPRAGVMIQQRANYIYCKPAKEKVGAVESAFVLTVLSLATLGPSGWILAHLDHYKTRNK
ncbi:hypothetical protein PAMP_020715 [Pampus punctatissimus]